MAEAAVLGVLVSALAAWVVLIVLIGVAARRHRVPVGVATRTVRDTIRLLRSLAADREMPRSIRWRLGFALFYCCQPFNLIPDFIPVIGYADNIVVAAWALRSVISIAGSDVVEQRWPGSPEGLAILWGVLHLGSSLSVPSTLDTSPSAGRAVNPTGEL
jgi:uncharacterized membrane protein YkvA (DUF1232 family)